MSFSMPPPGKLAGAVYPDTSAFRKLRSCSQVLAPSTSQSSVYSASAPLLIGRKVAMLRCRSSFFALLLVPFCALAQPRAPYYPDAVWQRKTPGEAGVDAQGLKDA